MDRARYVTLSRNSGSLASLRSGVRQWHVFAVSVLHYKVDLSAPPRSSEHVLCWLSCFAHHGTAMNYLGYLKNFCEIEDVSTKWYNESVRAWRKGAQKLKIAAGFKYTGKRVLFSWEWIKKLVAAFDRQRMSRASLFLLVCWAFLLRPLSEAFPMQVCDERDTCSLPEEKHSGIWVDRQSRANLRLLKRKHRRRGSHMQRLHTCSGQRNRVFCCLPCRLKVALTNLEYGDHLFTGRPTDMMKLIKSQFRSLSIGADRLTWKSFRAGHATHLAVMGAEI